MLLFLGFWFILLFSSLNFLLCLNNKTAIFELLLSIFLIADCGFYLFVQQNLLISCFLLLNLLCLARQFRFIAGLIKKGVRWKHQSSTLDKPKSADFPVKS